MTRLALAFMAAFLAYATPAFADGLAEIRSQASLDEARGYCVDMIGSQARASTDRPLQAHTCYAYQGRIAVDQGVSVEDAARAVLRFPHFAVCLDGASARPGGSVTLQPCGRDAGAMVAFDGSRILPAGNPDVCLTIAGGASRPGNGGTPPHLIRGLSWEACGGSAAPRQEWALRP